MRRVALFLLIYGLVEDSRFPIIVSVVDPLQYVVLVQIYEENPA